MRLSLGVVCMCFALAGVIRADKPDLSTLREEIKSLEEAHGAIEEVLNTLSVDNIGSLAEEEQNRDEENETSVGISSEIDVSRREKLLARLDELEKDIMLLDNYIGGEKETDQFLSRLPTDLMDGFKGKMKQTNDMVQTMKGEVKKSLVGVKSTLLDVETSAKSRNVEVAGVMYYEGVGSACALENMGCRVVESECRSGICQCRAGLSYDGLTQECTESCPEYGNTYQTVDKHIIRGYNNLTMENTTLAECKTQCQQTMDFVCRSFDYFPRLRTCFLSQFVVGDVPEEKWEHNEIGYHFQRDCLI